MTEKLIIFEFLLEKLVVSSELDFFRIYTRFQKNSALLIRSGSKWRYAWKAVEY